MDHVLTGDPFEIRVTDFGEGIFFWRCQGKVTGGRDVAIPVLMTTTITIEGYATGTQLFRHFYRASLIPQLINQ
ncbi:hypothetical protein A7589_18550 [Escherichia sp. MOD1-EC6475]|nr:hypothetical protein A7589_18550 [Escherichia sp. MOD1-EC6475]